MALVQFEDLPSTNTPINSTNLNNNFTELLNLITPIGSIFEWATDTAPSHYLICDGSAISRTTYADLFSIIGTTFGTGDGSSTFNLPNFKGRIPVGKDSNDTDFDTIGETGGSKYLQEHRHDLTLVKSRSLPLDGGGGSSEAGPSGYNGDNSGVATNTGSIKSAGTGNSGNLQPYIVANYIIRAY